MAQMTIKNRKNLKVKMAKALSEDIKTIPAEMQEILLDDVVTAFENRLVVLSKAKSNVQCYVNVGVEVTQ